MRRRGTIYYIACREVNRVKIGFTTGEPEVRLRALQTGSPAMLTLLAVHSGSLHEEAALHARFQHVRSHGEWFDMNDELFGHMCMICLREHYRAEAQGSKTPEWALLGIDALQTALGHPFLHREGELA